MPDSLGSLLCYVAWEADDIEKSRTTRVKHFASLLIKWCINVSLSQDRTVVLYFFFTFRFGTHQCTLYRAIHIEHEWNASFLMVSSTFLPRSKCLKSLDQRRGWQNEATTGRVRRKREFPHAEQYIGIATCLL